MLFWPQKLSMIEAFVKTVNITIFNVVYYLHKNIQHLNNYQLFALFILLMTHAAQIEEIDLLQLYKT